MSEKKKVDWKSVMVRSAEVVCFGLLGGVAHGLGQRAANAPGRSRLKTIGMENDSTVSSIRQKSASI